MAYLRKNLLFFSCISCLPVLVYAQAIDPFILNSGDHRVQVILETAPTGHATSWYNLSGHSGTVIITKAYITNNDKGDTLYCREYQQTVTVEGKSQQVYGKACRQPDGSWQVVS